MPKDGCLRISNDSKAGFSSTISRNRKLIAMVKYTGADYLLLNTNWYINSNGVQNRECHKNPDLVRSQNLQRGTGRIDLKMDETGCAVCICSNIELLFIRMNGNRVVPKINGLIGQEVNRQVAQIKGTLQKSRGLGQNRFLDWINSIVQPFEPFVGQVE